MPNVYVGLTASSIYHGIQLAAAIIITGFVGMFILALGAGIATGVFPLPGGGLRRGADGRFYYWRADEERDRRGHRYD